MKSFAALIVAFVVLLATAEPASAATRLVLPEPSGPFPVGETELHLVDPARDDPWVGGPRELMVGVHYPAVPTPGGRAPYMLPGAAQHFDAVTANGLLGLGTPPGTDWASVRTNARQNAPALPGKVIVYSSGLGEPRTWGTSTAEELASRGYVVVSIDNTYESPEVQFPDGSVRTMIEPGDPDAFVRKALDVRVRDTSFVLDALGRRGLDVSRVGMVGQSAGGAAAAATMAVDPRVVAGVNLDGNLTWLDGSLMPAAANGLARPFLLIGKDGETDTGPGWDAFLANTEGWARQLRLLGSVHATFTDAEALLPQLGITVGTLDPATAIRTQRAYVASFFDRWLHGQDNHLLDGPSPRYPEMAFVG